MRYIVLAMLLLGLAQGAASAQTEITIATWNIAWLNADDDTGMIKRKPADYRRLAKYAKRLNADIVAVEEVDGEAAARRVFSATAYDFYFSSDSNVQNVGFVVRKGIAVTQNPDYLPIKVSGGLRPGVDITVTVGGRQLRLMGVHLKCCCPSGPLTAGGQHCPSLQRQVPELEAWIDARAVEPVPFIVLGDFNRRLKANEVVWREIDDSDPPNADLTSLVEGLQGRCWNDDSNRDFIDHIILDLRAAKWLVPGSAHQERYEASDRPHAKRISDHCPLRTTLRIN